jgi:hypothetical protein
LIDVVRFTGAGIITYKLLKPPPGAVDPALDGPDGATAYGGRFFV